jgi:hypothetical protein
MSPIRAPEWPTIRLPNGGYLAYLTIRESYTTPSARPSFDFADVCLLRKSDPSLNQSENTFDRAADFRSLCAALRIDRHAAMPLNVSVGSIREGR